MRVDVDVAREVLSFVGALPFHGGPHRISIDGRDDTVVAYHVMALEQRGLLKACDASTYSGPCWMPICLTYEGSEFLAAAESDTVWNKTKDWVLGKTGTITLEAVKVGLPLVVKSLLADKLPL